MKVRLISTDDVFMFAVWPTILINKWPEKNLSLIMWWGYWTVELKKETK